MLSSKGVENFFESVFGNPDVLARSKVEVGKLLIETHELDTSRTVMIGDTLHDLEVATEMGIECMLVSTGHHSHERLQAAGVPVVESIHALTR